MSLAPGQDTRAALEALLDGRFSCRAYGPEPVPRERIERALALAQRTPSWCNTQPWQVSVVSGDRLARLCDALGETARRVEPERPHFPFPEAYLGIYRDRRKVCGVQLYQSLGIGREDREAARTQALENFRVFGAPHAAFVTTPAELGVYGAVDCGLWLMGFLLALESLGIQSIAQAALASWPDVVDAHVGLGEGRRLVFGVAFGHGRAAAPVNAYRTVRAPVAEAVRFVD
ncbi:MAG: nitroreductase [Betaproteobacteria bacterium]